MVEFHAVQCFDCSVFQVQQVKKVAKYTCRLCGAKQSVKQVYGISHKASDVRSVVTSLNARRQAADDARDGEWPDEEEPPSVAKDAHQKPSTDWDIFLEEEQLCGNDTAQHGAVQEAYVTQLPERRAKRGHGGQHKGVENLALAVGHARKKTVQSGSAARCAAPGVRADLRSRHEPCSSQLHRPLHDNHNGSTTAAASAFGQQNTVRGRLQPGKPAAHAATQAGTAAHVLTREGSRWEEFQELSESCGDQELLDTKVAPDHHVARTAWHSTAAHMPDDVSNIVTSYD